MEIISKKYLNETVLCTFNKISSSQAFLPSFANDLINRNDDGIDIYEDDDEEDGESNFIKQ